MARPGQVGHSLENCGIMLRRSSGNGLFVKIPSQSPHSARRQGQAGTEPEDKAPVGKQEVEKLDSEQGCHLRHGNTLLERGP